MTSPTTLRIHQVSVAVRDIEASVAWYREVLGLSVLEEDERRGGTPGDEILLGPPDWSFSVKLQVDQANEHHVPTEARSALDRVSEIVDHLLEPVRIGR